jgi:hypothetical protein
MNEAHDPPPRETEGEEIEPDRRYAAGSRSDYRRWNGILGRGLFETIIVAVGVFLALFVDEWRDRSEQRQLAQQARTALHAELLANREAVLRRLRRTSELYVQIPAHPDQIAQFIYERRNFPLQLSDGAWTMTVETGAIRWLDPPERTAIADVYAGYGRMRDVVSEELVRWIELAAFPSNPTSDRMQEDRDRAIRVWRAWAVRSQMAQCVNAGRHERALGAHVEMQQISEFCAKQSPAEDPAVIYVDWKKRGWLSPTLPQILSEAPASQ